jgi:hypothetical protein
VGGRGHASHIKSDTGTIEGEVLFSIVNTAQWAKDTPWRDPKTMRGRVTKSNLHPGACARQFSWRSVRFCWLCPGCLRRCDAGGCAGLWFSGPLVGELSRGTFGDLCEFWHVPSMGIEFVTSWSGASNGSQISPWCAECRFVLETGVAHSLVSGGDPTHTSPGDGGGPCR